MQNKEQEKRDLEDLVLIILCIILPPAAVLLKAGPYARFWVNILLTIFLWIPGVVHAIWVVMTERNTPIGWYFKNRKASKLASTTTATTGRTGFEATTVQPTGTGFTTTTTNVPATTAGTYIPVTTGATAFPSTMTQSPSYGVKVPVGEVRMGQAELAVPPGLAKPSMSGPSAATTASTLPTTAQ